MAAINPNTYSLMMAALATELAALVSTYAGIVITKRLFRPGDLPAFERYMVVVSPHGSPWDENHRQGSRMVEYVHRADLWLLVQNFDPELSLFGTTSPNRGIFQLIEDAKFLLRASTLGGLIHTNEKTYEEPAGPLAFESSAVAAFESGDRTFVHRARLVYTTPMHAFCQPRVVAA